MNQRINQSKPNRSAAKFPPLQLSSADMAKFDITVTDREPPVQVGILLPGEKVVFQPQYCFIGKDKLDLHTRTRLMEICEAFAYVSGLPVAIKWDGKIQIVKYDADASQYIK